MVGTGTIQAGTSKAGTEQRHRHRHRDRDPYAHADRRLHAGHPGEDPEMTRHEKPTLAVGLLACCAGVVVLLLALVLGFNIEGTPRAIADSAKGQRIAIPAVVALVAGVAALAGRRRGWAFTVGCVGAAAAVVAVLLAVLLHGG